MQIFVYEFVTGGGFLSDDLSPPDSLLREGKAMRSALTADLARLEGVEVVTMQDHRIPVDRVAAETVVVANPESEHAAFMKLAGQSEWTVVIAPEFEGLLQRRAGWVVSAGGRLLGPPVEFIELASDKNQLAEHLATGGVPAAKGIRLARDSHLPDDFGYPAVLKPFDGAGSAEVRHVRTATDAALIGVLEFEARLERFVDGAAASVALLCGRDGHRALMPCRQHLSEDGRFSYLGGTLPMPDDLSDRARRLAMAAVDVLPNPVGYVGVDLVLGQAADGDRVIEINPRLTTSYVGLRAACQQNLAGAMLDIAGGCETVLSFDIQPLEFLADGSLRRGCVR